jgi:hypothetical protein
MPKDSRIPARLAVIPLLLACAFCATTSRDRIRVEIPTPAALDARTIDSLILTNFKLVTEDKNLALNKELGDYWSGELAARFKDKVIPRDVRFEKDGLFEDAGFWKELSGGAPRAVVLTGRVGFSLDVRKSLTEKERGGIQEPFFKEKTWDTRKSYTLDARLYLIAADTGRVILDREYQETTTTSVLDQSPVFILYELLQRVKVRFFRDAFGVPRVQDRYLLR